MAYPKVSAKCNNVLVERSLFRVQHFCTDVHLESALIYNDEYTRHRTPQSVDRQSRVHRESHFGWKKITVKCAEIGFGVRGSRSALV